MTAGDIVHGFLRRHVRVLGSVLRVSTSEPVVVMTYDDGPEPGQTEGVLAALEARGATATFFLLGRRAQREPELVRRIAAEGHEIALHGYDHRPLSTFRRGELTSRLRDARAGLEDVAGVPVTWMRPPYGRQSPAAYLAIRRAGLIPVLWGATVLDGRDATTAERLASAMRGAAPGTILLCHDGRAGLDDGVDDGEIPPVDRGRLAGLVLDEFAARGLRGVSLADALVAGSAVRRAWFG